jgi:hypothetical protein
VKLGIKKKRQEEGEEKGCMERKVHNGNKWWKIMTIYSKEVKTRRRRVEDAMKENREICMLIGRGLQFSEPTRKYIRNQKKKNNGRQE